VHLLGGRPYEQLPAYCRGFDVGLIPFRMNRLTRAVNPIKLREYLAAGLPVVSSPMQAVLGYAPAVRCAQNLEQFLVACESALDEARQGGWGGRQRLVRAESWAARVEHLSRLVTELPPTGTAEAPDAADGNGARAITCDGEARASADEQSTASRRAYVTTS
jgi:hypothetical protein